MKVDLITGFLGVGKTTFLRGYIEYFKELGQKVHIIENEFGSVSVDSFFLKDETDEHCDISDLAGMCMCCVGKETFIHLLVDAAKAGYDRILVEPSGIYDVDEFFEVLSHPEVAAVCEIGSILTIIDPWMEREISEETKYLIFAQILAAGKIIFSKTQLADEIRIRETGKWLENLLHDHGINEVAADILTKDWSLLTSQDYQMLSEAGYNRLQHQRLLFNHEETYDTVQFPAYALGEEDLRQRIKDVFADDACGSVLRVKGMVRIPGKQCLEVNCTRKVTVISPSNVSRGVLVMIGENLKEELLMEHFLRKKDLKEADAASAIS